MHLFGQSKRHKLLSSLAFMLAIVLLVSQSSYVEQVKQIILAEPLVQNSFSYQINAKELPISSEEQIYRASQSYHRDEQALSALLEQHGISSAEFIAAVETVVVIKNGNVELQFSSTLALEKLKPVYQYLGDDFKKHILSQQSLAEAQ